MSALRYTPRNRTLMVQLRHIRVDPEFNSGRFLVNIDGLE